MGNKGRVCIKIVSILEGLWVHGVSQVTEDLGFDCVVREPKIYKLSWVGKSLFNHINDRQLISQRYSYPVHLYLIHEKLITWEWISVDLSGLISRVGIQFSHRLCAWAQANGWIWPPLLRLQYSYNKSYFHEKPFIASCLVKVLSAEATQVQLASFFKQMTAVETWTNIFIGLGSVTVRTTYFVYVPWW